MLLLWTFATIVAGISIQTSTQSSSTIGSDVPTGTPVLGNNSGLLRPQIHFSPPKDLMDDPSDCFVTLMEHSTYIINVSLTSLICVASAVSFAGFPCRGDDAYMLTESLDDATA